MIRQIGEHAVVLGAGRSGPLTARVAGDPALRGAHRRRTPMIRLVNAYLPHAAAQTDPRLGAAFTRVTGLFARPEGLLRPDRVLPGARNGAAPGPVEHCEPVEQDR